MNSKSKYAIAEELRVSWSSAFLFIFFIFFLFNLWQTVHERWVVSYLTLDQNFVDRSFVVDYHIDFILYGIFILAIVAIVLIFVKGKAVWRFITSMQLAIVMITSITVGTILGTLVFQNAAPQDYISFYSEPMFNIFKALHLIDVFDAWWFLALELMLATSLVCVTIRTKPWSLGRIGSAAVHLGIVVIIVGAFFGTAFLTEGMMVIGENDQASFAVRDDFTRKVEHIKSILSQHPQFLSTLREKYPDITGYIVDNPQLTQLGTDGSLVRQLEIMESANIRKIPRSYLIDIGGQLRLDDFEELYYEDPYIVSLNRLMTRRDIRTGEEENIIRPVLQIEFDDTKPINMKNGLGQLRINKVYRHFNRTVKLVEEENGEPTAILSVENLSHNHGEEEVTHGHTSTQVLTEASLENPLRGRADRLDPAIPADANPFLRADSLTAFHLRFVWQEPDEAKLEELGITSPDSPYSLMARTMVESGGHTSIALKQDEYVALDGTDYRFKLLNFYHDFRTRQLEDGEWSYFNASEYLLNPTVELEAAGGELKEPMRMTISTRGPAPNDKTMQDFVRATDLLIGFIYSPATELLLVGETGNLHVYENGQLVDTVDLSNSEYNPPLSGVSLKLEDARRNAVMVEEITDDNPEERFAVEVQVTKGGEVQKQTLELYSELVGDQIQRNRHRFIMDLDEKNFLLFSVRQGDYIKDWRSHVTVLNDGQELRSHVLRVNEPLIHNGHYFYQNSWAPQVPYGVTPDKWYTILRVVHDPGLLLVYLGIAMLVFGSIYVFYIQPKFRRSNGTSRASDQNEE